MNKKLFFKRYRKQTANMKMNQLEVCEVRKILLGKKRERAQAHM